MNVNEANQLAFDLMAKHGFNLPIKWTNCKRELGCVMFRNKIPAQLRLSKSYVKVSSLDKVTDLILHEIAHMIAGCAAGHGPEWVAVCLRIGAKPEACASLHTESVVPTHEVKCTECGCVYKRLFAKSRKDYSVYSCRCGAGLGTIKCVPFWDSVKDELRKLVSA